MSHVPTILKSDRLVFEKCFPAETMTGDPYVAKLVERTLKYYFTKPGPNKKNPCTMGSTMIQPPHC